MSTNIAVESIVRDLVEVGIAQVRESKRKDVRVKAEKAAEERVLDALVGNSGVATRESFRKKLRGNELNDKEIDIQVAESASPMPMFELPGASMGSLNDSVRTSPVRISRLGWGPMRADSRSNAVADRSTAMT